MRLVLRSGTSVAPPSGVNHNHKNFAALPFGGYATYLGPACASSSSSAVLCSPFSRRLSGSGPRACPCLTSSRRAMTSASTRRSNFYSNSCINARCTAAGGRGPLQTAHLQIICSGGGIARPPHQLALTLTSGWATAPTATNFRVYFPSTSNINSSNAAQHHLHLPHLFQQVRWKRKGANRIGRPCWHHHGTNKVRGRMYYPFHKMIGKSANWHKYQERFVPPKAVEAKVRLVPTCYANYRAMRESKAWYWLLPKALAASTTGDEVLNSFLRFRHKQPKKIHHYLRCLARLLAVGGCDVADWRFKYIASRVKPLRFRIVNLPRLALMYAKLNAVKEVKDLTRFLHAKMEWYSMQQLSFVVRAFALVKLNDAFLFQTVVRRLQDSLEFHRAVAEMGGEGEEAAGEAILGVNVDGLLSPSGVGSGLLEKIRSRPNYKHQAYIGLSNVTYNKYHQGKHYRSPARQPNETVADYERRQRSLAIESRGSYAESRTYDAAGATKYKSSKPWGRQKRELPRLMSNSKELDLASDAGAAGGGGRPELGEAEAGPGGRAADLHGANGRSNARASAFRRGRSSSSGAATTTSTDFSSRVHPDTSLDCTEGTSAFRSTTASGAPAPAQIKGTGNYNSQTRAQLPEDHDYLRPPTMEELICVAEGFAALEFKHYEFCGTVAQEFLLQPFFHGDQHAEECGGSSEGSEQKDRMDPLVLLHASRLSLAFAKVGYRDYSFFAAVADLVVQRLASGSGSGARINTTSTSSSSFFIKLSPSMLVDILRAFRELGIHDPTLVHACSAELERRAYDYPARDMAFLSYVLSEMSGQVVGALSREYAALDLSAATAVAGAIAEIKSRRRMRAAGRSRASAADEINRSDEVEAGELLLDDHLTPRRRPGAAPTDGALDALLRKVSVLLTDNHRRESRERYEIGKMMEAMTLHLEPKEERQKLFHPFCRHLHRHLQFLEPVDFLRILSSLNRFECWDARVVIALGKWMQKRKGEFGKETWQRGLAEMKKLEARGE